MGADQRREFHEARRGRGSGAKRYSFRFPELEPALRDLLGK
jgi:hypothetical protein